MSQTPTSVYAVLNSAQSLLTQNLSDTQAFDAAFEQALGDATSIYNGLANLLTHCPSLSSAAKTQLYDTLADLGGFVAQLLSLDEQVDAELSKSTPDPAAVSGTVNNSGIYPLNDTGLTSYLAFFENNWQSLDCGNATTLQAGLTQNPPPSVPQPPVLDCKDCFSELQDLYLDLNVLWIGLLDEPTSLSNPTFADFSDFGNDLGQKLFAATTMYKKLANLLIQCEELDPATKGQLYETLADLGTFIEQLKWLHTEVITELSKSQSLQDLSNAISNAMASSGVYPVVNSGLMSYLAYFLNNLTALSC